MKKSARPFLFGLSLTALALGMSLPAQAQYMDYRSDKPGIELDLDVLNDLPPRASEKETPKAAPAPRYSMPPPNARDMDTADAPPAVPVPVVEPAPRKMHRPLFAAPIPTPMPREDAKPAPQPRPVAVPAPAARKPYNPYLTAPVVPTPAPPPRPVYAPAPVVPRALPQNVRDNLPAAARFEEDTLTPPSLPRRKPDAPVETQGETPKDVLSYPPAISPKAPLKHFAHPALPATAPQALPAEVISEAEMDVAPVTLPTQKPVVKVIAVEEAEENVTEDIQPATAPLLPSRKPENVLTQHTPEEEVTEASAKTAALPAGDIALPVEPPPRVFTRPALVTTDAAPPVRPVLKNAEVTMPISQNDFDKIAVNMERVPVQVAMAPPKPQHLAITAPLAADMTLEFDRTSESLNDTARAKLQNIIAHMSADDNKRLQIRAYATGEDGSKSSARSKSLTRATEIRSFLMDNGIRPTRVVVRALGQETDRKPLDRVDLIFMP